MTDKWDDILAHCEELSKKADALHKRADKIKKSRSDATRSDAFSLSFPSESAVKKMKFSELKKIHDDFFDKIENAAKKKEIGGLDRAEWHGKLSRWGINAQNNVKKDANRADANLPSDSEIKKYNDESWQIVLQSDGLLDKIYAEKIETRNMTAKDYAERASDLAKDAGIKFGDARSHLNDWSKEKIEKYINEGKQKVKDAKNWLAKAQSRMKK